MAALKRLSQERVEVNEWAGILPPLIVFAGKRTVTQYCHFLEKAIVNGHTRRAYTRALSQFLSWAEVRGLRLNSIQAVDIVAYVEQHPGSEPTVKQALSAIRLCFDSLVSSRVMNSNPATSVRGPRFPTQRAKTPVLSAGQARELLESIDTSCPIGLRDRALMAVMCYTFARVGVVVQLVNTDYFPAGDGTRLRLIQRDGVQRDVTVHHNLRSFLDEYIAGAKFSATNCGYLFQTAVGKTGRLSGRPMTENDVLRMVKRRAKSAGLPPSISCETFRATGIVTYLGNGGSLETAQSLAAHESKRSTQRYCSQAGFVVHSEEVERISI